VPRQRTEQFELFETGLFLAGGARVYLRNIMELARLLPSSESDIARAIDKNAIRAIRQIERAQAEQSKLAEMIGYEYLRKEGKHGRAKRD